MRTTVNYGFNMPDLEDFYNIEDFNENMESIDTIMYENELAVNDMSSEIKSVIGETADTGATASTGTVMGKLNYIISAPSSPIKKIIKGVSSSETVTISVSDPDKCIVILNCEVGVSGSSQAYGDGVHLVSLTATKMTVIRPEKYESAYSYSYQIVEFN